MDVSVLMMAVLLFIPVYLIGIVSNNRMMTLILAGALILVVMVYAGEKYVYFDVIGIGVAIYFAFEEIDE